MSEQSRKSIMMHLVSLCEAEDADIRIEAAEGSIHEILLCKATRHNRLRRGMSRHCIQAERLSDQYLKNQGNGWHG